MQQCQTAVYESSTTLLINCSGQSCPIVSRNSGKPDGERHISRIPSVSSNWVGAAVCGAAGIVANNASGMCCGVASNTYNTLDHMRIVFADGTLLDTADPASCASFSKVGSPHCSTAALVIVQVFCQVIFWQGSSDEIRQRRVRAVLGTPCRSTVIGLVPGIVPAGRIQAHSPTRTRQKQQERVEHLLRGLPLHHVAAVHSHALPAMPHTTCCLCICLQSHAQLCGAVSGLAAEVQGDKALASRIKHKFKIKNTVSKLSHYSNTHRHC
jgi:hypothetical protein